MSDELVEKLDSTLDETRKLYQILYELMAFTPECKDVSYYEKSKQLEKFFGRMNSIE